MSQDNQQTSADQHVKHSLFLEGRRDRYAECSCGQKAHFRGRDEGRLWHRDHKTHSTAGSAA